MSHSLYFRIMHAIEGHDDYFVQKEIETDVLDCHVYRRLLQHS
jgi:hypothetical protein